MDGLWTLKMFLALDISKEYMQNPWKIPAKSFFFKERCKLKYTNFTQKELLHMFHRFSHSVFQV